MQVCEFLSPRCVTGVWRTTNLTEIEVKKILNFGFTSAPDAVIH